MFVSISDYIITLYSFLIPKLVKHKICKLTIVLLFLMEVGSTAPNDGKVKSYGQ